MRLAPRDSFLHGHLPDEPLGPHQHVIVDTADWEEARRILFAERSDSTVRQVTLSRSNLIRLLSKLEDNRESHIIKPGGLYIVAEPDGVHYKHRCPGKASEETQKTIDEIEDLLTLRRRLKS